MTSLDSRGEDPPAPDHPPPDLPQPVTPVAPPTLLPAPPAQHGRSRSPSPAPRRSTHQRFEPCPNWVSNAPLIPIPQDAPAPPAAFPSPEAAAIDKGSYQELEGE